MKIVNLIENTCNKEHLISEHGLSFYIETGKHKILFDTGASNAFAKNAQVLGIDLKQIDSMILSHGHYDHAGGVLEFARINNKALIYMRDNAFDAYYSEDSEDLEYIGINKKIAEIDRVVKTNGNIQIDEELSLFTNVLGRDKWPEVNKRLKVKRNQQLLQDEFRHEQNLVVNDDGKTYLFAGCSHNGVVNILKEYYNIYDSYPDVYIGGLHLMKHSEYTESETDLINELADFMIGTGTLFYTCHCTGIEAYNILKNKMNDHIHSVQTGDSI